VTRHDREYEGITEVYALQAWCRTVAGKDFTVEFRDDVQTAMVYRKHIIFPRPNSSMTKRDSIRMRGLMLHETSHPMYQPDYDDTVDKYRINMQAPLGMVWNILLDVHAESCRARAWPGDSKGLSEFGTVVGLDLQARIIPQLKSPETIAKGLDTDFKNLSIVMLAGVEVEGSWNIGMRLSFAPVRTAFGDEVGNAADDVVARFDLHNRLLDPDETAESLLLLAKEIYRYLWQTKGEDEQPESGKGPPSDQKGEGKDEKAGGKDGKPSNGEPNESGNDKGDKGDKGDEPESDTGPASGNNGEQSDEDGNTPRDEGGTMKLKGLLFTDHYQRDEGGNPENAGGSGVHFDYSDYSETARYQPTDPAQIELIKYED